MLLTFIGLPVIKPAKYSRMTDGILWHIVRSSYLWPFILQNIKTNWLK